jgi:hypothetical protein
VLKNVENCCCRDKQVEDVMKLLGSTMEIGKIPACEAGVQ